MAADESKRLEAMKLRYKRPVLMSLSLEAIQQELEEITDACSEVQWMSEDEELLLSALDGNEDQLWEFKVSFSDLSGSAYQLDQAIHNNAWDMRRFELEFDDCLVSLLGNRYHMVGWDDYEEDYYSLTTFERDLALTETGKRLSRLTKKDLLATVGQCLGIVISFLDVRYKYDYLKATLEVLRGSKDSVLQTIREIEQLYDDLQKLPLFSSERRQKEEQWERLMGELPQRTFLE